MDVSKISSAIQSGLTGYKAAEQGVAEAAQNINRLNTERDRVAQAAEADSANNLQTGESGLLNQRPGVSLEAEAVNLVVNEYLAKANINTIKTADEMLGSLVDTKV